MVTKSAPAAALMLLLLSAVELKLKELLAADDIKTIYRIEGAARAMVSMARVAAAAQRVTDPEPASNTAPTPTDPEDETMNAADPNAGLSPREQLERRLVQFELEIERKRAELAEREGGPVALAAGLDGGRGGDDGGHAGLEPDGP